MMWEQNSSITTCQEIMTSTGGGVKGIHPRGAQLGLNYSPEQCRWNICNQLQKLLNGTWLMTDLLVMKLFLNEMRITGTIHEINCSCLKRREHASTMGCSHNMRMNTTSHYILSSVIPPHYTPIHHTQPHHTTRHSWSRSHSTYASFETIT